MRSVGLIGLVAIVLAAPMGADEAATPLSGVWFGEHPALAAHSSAVLPSEGGLSAFGVIERGSGAATSAGIASSVLERGLLILRLEPDDDHIDGSMVLTSPDRSKEARAARALESLGITTQQQLSGIRFRSEGAITGTVENVGISFAAYMKTARMPRHTEYTASGEIQGDEMRLKVTNVLRQASMTVRLQRCVAPPERSEAEACSDEALWRQYLETID